ncbi:MAG TPA: FAD:protein FMN transferase, partial [Limnochordia bacterium]|nr:FAD:protein FMN transferase [Limnochordia bacterium]
MSSERPVAPPSAAAASPEGSAPAVPQGMRDWVFAAMGTQVRIVLVDGPSAADGAASVQVLFALWEQHLSRFRSESELSRLNNSAGRPVTVSPLLFDVCVAALAAAQATGGIYDPTLLPQLIDLGYDRSFDDIASQCSPPSVNGVGPKRPLARRGGDWRGVRLDRTRRTVTLPPGAALDFGGIAKGMAVDAAL